MPLLLKLMLLLMLMGGLSARVLRRCHRRCHRTSRVVADAVGGAAGVDAGADVTAVASFELVVAFNGRGFTVSSVFFSAVHPTSPFAGVAIVAETFTPAHRRLSDIFFCLE